MNRRFSLCWRCAVVVLEAESREILVVFMCVCFLRGDGLTRVLGILYGSRFCLGNLIITPLDSGVRILTKFTWNCVDMFFLYD